MKVTREPANWWARLWRRLLGLGTCPAPPDRARLRPAAAPRRPPPSGASAAETDVESVRTLLETLVAEVRQLRQAIDQGEHRAIHIHRVDRMDVEQMHHTIGRLDVDQLEGTLNVGFSRNVKVNPRVPRPEPRPTPAPPSPPPVPLPLPKDKSHRQGK